MEICFSQFILTKSFGNSKSIKYFKSSYLHGLLREIYPIPIIFLFASQLRANLWIIATFSLQSQICFINQICSNVVNEYRGWKQSLSLVCNRNVSFMHFFGKKSYFLHCSLIHYFSFICEKDRFCIDIRDKIDQFFKGFFHVPIGSSLTMYSSLIFMNDNKTFTVVQLAAYTIFCFWMAIFQYRGSHVPTIHDQFSVFANAVEECCCIRLNYWKLGFSQTFVRWKVFLNCPATTFWSYGPHLIAFCFPRASISW